MRYGAIALVLLLAQAAPKPAFEVASIKRNTTVERSGGGGFAESGRFRLVNVSAGTLILIAFRTDRQLFPSQIIGAPDWTSSEYYDITAKVSDELAATPRSQLFQIQGLLLQSLLEDRFKLKVHRETRQMPIYSLGLARRDGTLGPQLRRTSVDCAAEPQQCGVQGSPGHFTSGGTRVSALISFLAPQMQRVVVDRTGLEGRYEMNLEFTPDRMPLPLGTDAPPPADKPSIVTALQDQLGLKLEQDRGPVDVIVIDHVERPTED